VLLHGCGGGYLNIDDHWGKTIASWGYVSLSIDSFGPRGITETCDRAQPRDTFFDAYRGSQFLAQQPCVDRNRLAMIGFSRGGGIALWSVDGSAIQQLLADRFRAVVAFYPPCRFYAGKMTVPTLILIGERDDWTPAQDCRDMVSGTGSSGPAEHGDDAHNVQLMIYPDAHHEFDEPELRSGNRLFGHWQEYNKSAADQSARDLHKFLDDQIGGR
jgi:dienelactone hydrolase